MKEVAGIIGVVAFIATVIPSLYTMCRGFWMLLTTGWNDKALAALGVAFLWNCVTDGAAHLMQWSMKG